jgi:hypothetical protein
MYQRLGNEFLQDKAMWFARNRRRPPRGRRAAAITGGEAMKPTSLNLVLGILGILAVMCLGGIIFLAAQQPARSIPDILVGTTTLIVGGVIGLLVPSRPGTEP